MRISRVAAIIGSVNLKNLRRVRTGPMMEFIEERFGPEGLMPLPQSLIAARQRLWQAPHQKCDFSYYRNTPLVKASLSTLENFLRLQATKPGNTLSLLIHGNTILDGDQPSLELADNVKIPYTRLFRTIDWCIPSQRMELTLLSAVPEEVAMSAEEVLGSRAKLCFASIGGDELKLPGFLYFLNTFGGDFSATGMLAHYLAFASNTDISYDRLKPRVIIHGERFNVHEELECIVNDFGKSRSLVNAINSDPHTLSLLRSLPDKASWSLISQLLNGTSQSNLSGFKFDPMTGRRDPLSGASLTGVAEGMITSLLGSSKSGICSNLARAA